MIILYVILGIVVLFLAAGLFMKKDFNYEKSVLINAGREKVWPHVHKLSDMDDWSPWMSKDPEVKRTLIGTDGTVGAKMAWVSKVKNVGEGSQTIVSMKEHERINTLLEFLKPFKSKAQAYITLDTEGNSTRVTWGFKSRMPYPMNMMSLFMNFDKAMDADFGSGLGKLKELCEK